MTKKAKRKLAQQIAGEPDLTIRRELALDLLSSSQERQLVDTALLALEQCAAEGVLQADDRAVLHSKALYYFENDDKDSGGLLREKLIRLLADYANPDDIDVYLLGVNTYEPKPVIDVAQTLRAAALVGLAGVARDLCCAHAVRLLGEKDTSQLSGEPSLTAIAVLARFAEPLPIYQFLLFKGADFARGGLGEVVGRALEMLGGTFPLGLYMSAAGPLLALDVPAVSAGVINFIVQGRVEALYPTLEQVIDETRDADLYRYGLIMMAASRDETLAQRLYDRAKCAPKRKVPDYLEAVELTAFQQREAVAALLRARL